MTNISSHLANFASRKIRRIALGTTLLAGSLANAACGPSLHHLDCGAGRVAYQGSCVAQETVDYIECVRAQNAYIEAQKNQGVDARAGYQGVQVGGGFRNDESLTKRYTANDEATMAIIHACNEKYGIAPPPKSEPDTPQVAGYWAGTASERGQRYTMHVKVASQGPGRCAAIAYPELGCVTVLECDQPATDGSIRARERVVRGRNKCVDGGVVTLAPRPNGTLSFLWKGHPRHGVVTSSLYPDRTM